MEAYLEHGIGTSGPYSSEQVEIKENVTARMAAIAAMPFHSGGYGRKDYPTSYMIHWRNRWRRVYSVCYSNSASYYIKTKDSDISVSLYN